MVTRPVFFIDTNALHYASLYLRFAKRENTFPYAGDETAGDEHIRQARLGLSSKDLVQGRKLVSYLRQKCQLGAEIEYSPITFLEMMCGVLRGKAVVSAAGEGIPNRMWSRMGEGEIVGRLADQAYREAHEAVDGLVDEFSGVGVDIGQTANQRLPDIWHLARRVLSVVFLDVQDCLVYSSAVLAEAESLLTTDGHLRKVTNAMENPGAAPQDFDPVRFVRAKGHVVDWVAQLVGIREDEVRLPTAPREW